MCAVIVPVVAYALSARQPAQYQAQSQVYLSSQDLAGALTGISVQYVDEERLADTQASLAQVPTVAQRAIDLAGVQGVSAADLLASATVAPDVGTNILTFTITINDPEKAQLLATAYGRAFTTYRGELDTLALKRARDEVKGRLEQLSAAGEDSGRLANSLRDKEQQLATLEALQTSRTYVIRTADGAAKVAPTPRRYAILGLILGIVLGLGLAVALEALDTRVRSSAEVGQRLGLAQLARIPPPPRGFGKGARLVMLAQPTGPSAEAFRMLRTNLQFASLASDGVRTIVVTSAVEQEGKSTTAANLAVAEARAGKRVALVDLDLRVPYLDRFFRLTRGEGVTDVALGNATLQEALKPIDLGTGMPTDATPTPLASTAAERGSLSVLIAGPRPPDPGEFIGSQRLRQIVDELAEMFDLVIIDTPPVLRVGDAMTLSTSVDGILVVTKLNVIRRQMLSELRQALAAAPAAKLGFIVTGSRDLAGYGYGYGYGYGEPYGHGQSTRRGAETEPERV